MALVKSGVVRFTRRAVPVHLVERRLAGGGPLLDAVKGVGLDEGRQSFRTLRVASDHVSCVGWSSCGQFDAEQRAWWHGCYNLVCPTFGAFVRRERGEGSTAGAACGHQRPIHTMQ